MHQAVGKIAKIIILLALVMMAGCKPRVPKEYIQPSELEDILYDYHVADGMAYTQSDYQDLAFRRQAYRDAALRKHGVTQAQLDSSLVYYYRHTERLHDIYQNLAKRLNNDAIALGATTNELSQFEGMTSQGDTATVWSSAQSVAFMPQAPYNCITFDAKADTAYHAGDKMILSFDCQFIFQDGTRDGVAMLAVIFNNDSTATQTMHLSADNHYSLQITDSERLGIKQVKGFIYLGKGSSMPTTPSASLKLMCVNNMKLMRMHISEQPKEETPGMGNMPGMGSLQAGDTDQPAVPMHPSVDNGDSTAKAQNATQPDHQDDKNRPMRRLMDRNAPPPPPQKAPPPLRR